MTSPLDEQEEHRTAARAGQDHPGWLILWGTHTRLYWAFPRFSGPPGTIIAVPDTSQLTERMHEAELTAARPPMPAQPPGRLAPHRDRW